MCTLNQSFCQDMYEWSHQDLKGKPPSPLNWQNTYCPKYTNMTTCITEAWKTASHHPLWCMFYFTITNWCFYARQESLKTGVTYPFHFCCLQDPATPKAESCMAANLNLQNLGPLKAIEKKLWGVKIIHLLVLQKCSNMIQGWSSVLRPMKNFLHLPCLFLGQQRWYYGKSEGAIPWHGKDLTLP